MLISAAIFILWYWGEINLLPPDAIPWHGVRRNKSGTHYSSCFPSTTWKKPKSQEGALLKNSLSNGNDTVWQENLTQKPGKASQNHSTFEEILVIQEFSFSHTVAWTESSYEEHIQTVTALKTVEQGHRGSVPAFTLAPTAISYKSKERAQSHRARARLYVCADQIKWRAFPPQSTSGIANSQCNIYWKVG